MNALNIVLICVVSVFIFVNICWFLGKKYTRKFFIDEIVDFSILDKYAPKKPIVMLGDSLTDFFPIGEFMASDNIINRGIAGDKVEDISNRLQEVIDLHPKKVFFQIGINNLIQKGHKIDFSVLIDNIINIINRLTDEGIKVYTLSLYPINRKKMKMGFSKIICNHANNERVMIVNNLLEQACKNNNYDFINVYPLLIDSLGNLKKEFTIEGLHLNVLCYETIFHAIKEYV